MFASENFFRERANDRKKAAEWVEARVWMR
jgi:hypothetical protein